MTTPPATAQPNWPVRLGLFAPTAEQAAVIAAPPGPLVVIAGAGAGKTETMAARVVWLVANGYAEPGQVLGLTFTRKAAGQLLRRVRSRLARLAGAGLMTRPAWLPRQPAGHADGQHLPRIRRPPAARSTALLLPVEPDTRLLSETELWQLAFDVVSGYPGELDTDKTPAAVTSMVLRLSGQLAEHLVDTDQLRDTHLELERLVHTLPAGPLSARPRTQPVAAADAGHPDRAHRARAADRRPARADARREGDGLRHADGRCRAAGDGIPAGRRATAAALPGGAARRVPGHRPRPAGRVVVAVRRRGRRRLGADRGRRPDPVDLRLARRVGDQPAAVHHRLPALRRHPGADAGTAHQLAQPAAGAAGGQRGVGRGAATLGGGARAAAAPRCRARHRPLRAAARRGGRTGLGRRPSAPAATSRPPTTAWRRRPPQCWCAATPTPRRWPMRCAPAGSRSRWSAWPGCWRCPRSPTWWRCCGWSPTRPPVRPRCGCSPGRAGGSAPATSPRCGGAPSNSTASRCRAPASTAEQIVGAAGARRRRRVPGRRDLRSRPGQRYSAAGYRRIVALGRRTDRAARPPDHPLPDLVAEVRRLLGVDSEVRAAQPGRRGLVGHRASRRVRRRRRRLSPTGASAASVDGLLAYLDAADSRRERLGARAKSAVAPNRVQILTVHAAKGLEWQVVAVPHLSARVFPSTASARTWLTDAADLPPLLRGDRAELGVHGVPVLDTSDVTDRKQLSDKISAHRRHLEQRRVDEERRLLYVAITRAEDTLLLSGHHWGATGIKPRGPSDFLCELKDIIDRSAAAGDAVRRGRAVGASACRRRAEPVARQRASKRSGRSTRGRRGAPTSHAGRRWWPRRCRRTLPVTAATPTPRAGPPTSTRCWPSVPASARPPAPHCPASCRSAPWSNWAETRAAPRAAAPAAADSTRSACVAGHRVSRLGAAVLRRRAAVRSRRPARRRRRRRRAGATPRNWPTLQAAFLASPWAARTPVDVEVPFEMVDRRTPWCVAASTRCSPTRRRRRHAWWTGRPASRRRRRRPRGRPPIQLAVYRLAWAALHGCPESSVRAAFHYVRTGRHRRRPTCCPRPTSWPRCCRATGRPSRLGVAPDLERRGDHRDLQRQPGDGGDPHGQWLVPPQPHHVELAGNTARTARPRRRRADRRVRGGQQQRADADFGDTRGIGVEPRTAGQLGGDRCVERLGADEMQ